MNRLSRLDIAHAVLWIIIAGIVFGLQHPNTGFSGYNHGWTSSHGMAIMSKATLENGFVGYAMRYQAADGSVTYDYFDRYPFFFGAAFNAVISVTDNLPTQVYIGRQIMNLFFVGTLIVSGLLVNRFVGNRFLAAAVTLLGFSGYWLVYYKDMVHYDQPALFGAFLLLYAITRYKLDDERRLVYVAALVAIGLGRGYASYMILALWVAIEGIGALRQRRYLAAFTNDAVRVFAIAVLWGGLLLGYNIVTEANTRGVPLQETSIIESANRRLPFGEGKQLGRNLERDAPTWGEYATLQFNRLPRWTVPYFIENGDTPRTGQLFAAVMLIAVPVAVFRERDPNRRSLLFLIGFWGIGWLAFMINLAGGHEYVMMYIVGLPLVFYITLLSPLKRSSMAVGMALAISIGLFSWSQYQVRARLNDPATNNTAFTEDFNRIASAIDGTGRHIHNHHGSGVCIIEDSMCYVLGFFLADHYLTPYETADYVVSRHAYYTTEPFLEPDDEAGMLLLSNPLRPENEVSHVFRTADAEPRTIPPDAETIVRFDEHLSLQSWALRDPVTVQPCQRVRFESWWHTDATLPDNYSMLLALVDENGASVADANHDLTSLPTKVWVPDTYLLDARSVQVPCDIGPGEYPLVMSVYAPGSPASLPVAAADGTPMSDFFYLTTLFVE